MTPLATSADVADLASAAREPGRLGIDTEFMGEGRYQALLCLVQVAVQRGGELVVAVLDPLDDAVDARSARRGARATRRSSSCCTPRARTSRC